MSLICKHIHQLRNDGLNRVGRLNMMGAIPRHLVYHGKAKIRSQEQGREYGFGQDGIVLEVYSSDCMHWCR